MASRSAPVQRRLAAGAVVLAVGLAVVAYALRLAGRMREPDANPRAFIRRGGRSSGTRLVLVCAGDSITHGVVSGDYPAMLAARLCPLGVEVLNAGINGNLAWNVLVRLDDVIACRPDVVTLLVGTNDVLAQTGPDWAADYVRRQHLPEPPSLDGYRASVAAILERLAAETSARVAMLDLPPLGEDLSSAANARLAEFREVLREEAASRGVPVLPLHDRLVALLPDGHRPPAFTGDKAKMGAALVRRLVLRESLARISASNGTIVLTDDVHLNEVGAGVVADLIEGFVLGG